MEKSSSASNLELHVVNSLRRNQERIQTHNKLGKNRAKYFGEIALSHRVAVNENKRHDQLQTLECEGSQLAYEHAMGSMQGISPTTSLNSFQVRQQQSLAEIESESPQESYDEHLEELLSAGESFI